MLFRGGHNRNLTFTRLFAFVSPFVCVAKLILRLPTWIAFLECVAYYVKGQSNCLRITAPASLGNNSGAYHTH